MEYFIEVREHEVINLKDWVYDGILNRLINELESHDEFELLEIFLESNRSSSGFLSFEFLDPQNFKKVFRYLKSSYQISKRKTNTLYNKKAHKEFFRAFDELINIFILDKRIQEII